MATTKKTVADKKTTAKTNEKQTARHVLLEKDPPNVSKTWLAFRKAVEYAKKNPIEYDEKAILK